MIGASVLPAPLHTAPSFLRAHCLSLSDKIKIRRAMATLTPAIPPDRSESFLDWLKRHGQSGQAIERFWKPILISALNEELDCVSVKYAAYVIRESFLKSAEAGRMGVPTLPLTELYSAAGAYVQARGGEIRLRTAIESFRAQASQVSVTAGGEQESFDHLVLAVPFDALARILPDNDTASPLRQKIAGFTTSPITGIHLWFDRQISDLDHAVLLDRTIQWMFHKSRLIEARQNGGSEGSYVELVVSSSKSLVDMSLREIVDLALSELREFFPAAREANPLGQSTGGATSSM